MSAPGTPTGDQVRVAAAALISARLGGCTCQPWIKLRRDGHGIIHAHIAHDSDCAHPSQRKGRDA